MFPLIARPGGKKVAAAFSPSNTRSLWEMAAAAFVARNLYNQQQALSGKKPPKEGSRLQAIAATQHFPEGTTGYGVHPLIRMIHAIGGGIGEAQIGTFFSNAKTKAELAKPIDSPSNMTVAQREFGYWNKVYQEASSPGDLVGGFLGSSVPPSLRAYGHQKAHDLRKYASAKNKDSES